MDHLRYLAVLFSLGSKVYSVINQQRIINMKLVLVMRLFIQCVQESIISRFNPVIIGMQHLLIHFEIQVSSSAVTDVERSGFIVHVEMEVHYHDSNDIEC